MRGSGRDERHCSTCCVLRRGAVAWQAPKGRGGDSHHKDLWNNEQLNNF